MVLVLSLIGIGCRYQEPIEPGTRFRSLHLCVVETGLSYHTFRGSPFLYLLYWCLRG